MGKAVSEADYKDKARALYDTLSYAPPNDESNIALIAAALADAKATDEILYRLRMAYIALLEAANFANENGSDEHEAYFDKAAKAAKAILEKHNVIGLYRPDGATP